MAGTRSSVAHLNSAPVLGLVPVHPPKFRSFARFLDSYASCDALARQALEVFAIFSSHADKVAFHANATLAPLLRSSIVLKATPPSPTQHHLVAWKRWMALETLDAPGEHGRPW